MTFPPSLKIGPHTYTVIYPHHFRERDDYQGQADHALKEIRISGVDCNGNQRPDSALLETFFHEIVHCVDIIYCMDKIGKEEEKERLIEGLSNGLAQVLIDNNLITLEGNY
jgi:hypothetical protein